MIRRLPREKPGTRHSHPRVFQCIHDKLKNIEHDKMKMRARVYLLTLHEPDLSSVRCARYYSYWSYYRRQVCHYTDIICKNVAALGIFHTTHGRLSTFYGFTIAFPPAETDCCCHGFSCVVSRRFPLYVEALYHRRQGHSFYTAKGYEHFWTRREPSLRVKLRVTPQSKIHLWLSCSFKPLNTVLVRGNLNCTPVTNSPWSQARNSPITLRPHWSARRTYTYQEKHIRKNMSGKTGKQLRRHRTQV